MDKLFNWYSKEAYSKLQNDSLLMEKLNELIGKIENSNAENSLPVEIDDETQLFLLFSSDQSLANRRNSFNKAWHELKNMYGMEKIQNLVTEWISELLIDPGQFKRNFELKKKEIIHIALLGDPGTGKTTVAKLLGDIMYGLGLINTNKFIKTGRQNIVGQYIGDTEANMMNLIKEASGGILFIDEAYSLVPADRGDRDFGKNAINVLVDRMLEGSFVLMVAGYSKEMNNFLEFNAGMKSRFTRILNLRNLNQEELIKYVKNTLSQKGYYYDSSFEQGLEKVIYAMEEEGFLNANVRDVNTKIVDRLVKRKVKEEIFTIEDLKKLPISNTTSPYNEEDLQKIRENARKKLNNFVGMRKAKQQLEFIINSLDSIRLERKNENWLNRSKTKINLNFALIGPTGTGKTQFAEVIGEFLRGSGFLPSSTFKKTGRKDFVSEYVGGTEEKTKTILNDAKGGVLFIDEAYTLLDKPGDQYQNGTKALEMIMEFIYNHRSEMACIIAGYRDKVEEVMEANEGMRRRFAHVIEFENFTAHEIYEIVKLIISRQEYLFSNSGAEDYLERVIKEYGERNKVFNGNGGWAEDFVEKISVSLRNKTHNKNIIENHDIDYAMSLKDPRNQNKQFSELDPERKAGLEEIKNKALKDIKQLTGMEKIKKQFHDHIKKIEIEKKKEKLGIGTAKARLHSAFIGPSGTGKTTVARIYADFLKGSGLLSRGNIIEAKKSDFIGFNTEETLKKTNTMVSKAEGGILFIDEAYSLTTDPLGLEVIDQLIIPMENKKDDFVVVLAGYREAMIEFLKANEGIKSRLGYIFQFEDYTSNDISQIFINKISPDYKLDLQANETLIQLLNHYQETESYFDGNGRWASNFAEMVIGQQGLRLANSFIGDLNLEAATTITTEDLINGLEEMKTKDIF